jgi:nitrite reductase/ring-hydroxylating ferredoxin subunit
VADGEIATPAVSTEWQALADIDLATAEFPARARCGDDVILVLRLGNGFRGIERSCPHQKRPLNDAILQGGDKMIRCRCDGRAVNCPGYRLRVYDIKQENGALFARPAT